MGNLSDAELEQLESLLAVLSLDLDEEAKAAAGRADLVGDVLKLVSKRRKAL